jgi:hypothetical protein
LISSRRGSRRLALEPAEVDLFGAERLVLPDLDPRDAGDALARIGQDQPLDLHAVRVVRIPLEQQPAHGSAPLEEDLLAVDEAEPLVFGEVEAQGDPHRPGILGHEVAPRDPRPAPAPEPLEPESVVIEVDDPAAHRRRGVLLEAELGQLALAGQAEGREEEEKSHGSLHDWSLSAVPDDAPGASHLNDLPGPSV